IGRSPVFATFRETTSRSPFKTISPGAAKISPGTISFSLTNWIVDANQFCIVRKRGFHLHFVNHFRDAFHHLISRQKLATLRHEFGDGSAIACSFEHEICDQRDTFWIVKLDASLQAGARHLSCDRYQQFVFFSWRKVHDGLRPRAMLNTTTSSAPGKARAPASCRVLRVACATQPSTGKKILPRVEQPPFPRPVMRHIDNRMKQTGCGLTATAPR